MKNIDTRTNTVPKHPTRLAILASVGVFLMTLCFFFAQGEQWAFTALMGSMIIFTCVMSYATVVSVMVMDELQQRIHLVAIAISGGLTGLAYSLTGVANAIAETPALPAFFAMPMMCILYAIGSATISARYR